MGKSNVSIGIAAYNAEKNIKHMISVLLRQKENDTFMINEIVIHSDASTDKTVQIAKTFKEKRLKVVDNKNRRGFAGAAEYLITHTRSEILVMLNDDIKIEDVGFVLKLIKPFQDQTVGLVCGHPVPLLPTNFVDSAIYSSQNAYYKMRDSINNGNCIYSCDGKILALGKDFIKKLKFPLEKKEMGNVDTYMYCSCKEEGFEFAFAKDAIVYFKNPTSFRDFYKWFTRNNAYLYLLRQRFGDLVDYEFKKPKFLFWRCLIPEFFKNPLGCLFIFGSSFYIRYKSKQYSQNFQTTWDVIGSTKNI